MPSCPVLKSFQQTVERRCVDSMLFLLKDRWLPVSMPLASGAVLPGMDVLNQLTSADRNAFPCAAFPHQSPLMRFVPQPSQCKVQCLESVLWARKKECTLRRPGCGPAPCFVDPHGETGWSPRSSSKPLRFSVKARLPQGFKWTSGKSKRRGDAPSPCPEAALAVAHVQSKFQPGKLIPGMALVQLGWEVLALAEKVMPGPAHM